MTRNFLSAMPAFALMLATVLGFGLNAHSQSAPAYAPQKVVYHNNGAGKDSPAYFKSLLRNLKNHVAAVGEGRVDIKVVNHGKGIGLLQIQPDDKETAGEIDALRAKGVQFLVCRNTLKRHDIDWHTLYGVKEADIVPSGMAELARLQQEGYVYVHP